MKKLHELKVNEIFAFIGKRGIYQLCEQSENSVTFVEVIFEKIGIDTCGLKTISDKLINRHNRTKIYNSYVIAITISGGTF